MLKRLVVGCLLLLSFVTTAKETESTEVQDRAPLVAFDVSVDTSGIAEAISETNEKLDEISGVLVQIAEKKDLTEEQARLISQTTDNINQLVTSSNSIIDRLPGAVSSARQELRTTGKLFFEDVKSYSIIILLVIAVILLIILYCFYRFVIRPLQHTITESTASVSGMAKSIEATAASLEVVNQSQLAIMNRLEKLEKEKQGE